jgi:hypothetical protein
VTLALLQVETDIDKADAVHFMCVGGSVGTEIKGEEVRLACRQQSAREFVRSAITCPPGAIAIGTVVILTVLACVVARKQAQNHSVAVYGQACGHSKCARG